MDNTKLNRIIEFIADKNHAGAIGAIHSALIDETGPDWQLYLNRLADFLIDGIPRFSINMEKGNSKLPFVAFSALPGARFCPGAGLCLLKCYSFKAHRYPAAFCRQVQNTILLNSARGRARIKADLLRIAQAKKYSEKMVFRLFVDGDYRNTREIKFWFNLLIENPKIHAYGYSKSFLVILDYVKKGGELPLNYTLNISSGHKHKSITVDKIRALLIARGEFISIPMHHIEPEAGPKHTRAQIQREYIATTGKKAFICPGKCGECISVKGENVHFCGTKNPIPVVIAEH